MDINHKNNQNKGYLWSSSDVSFGVSKNKIIDNMIKTKEITILHRDVNMAFIEDKLITMPFKTRFSRSEDYYQVVLHEYAHFKSSELNQDVILDNDYNAYFKKNGINPNTNEMLRDVYKPEDLAGKDNVTLNVIKSYLQEEAKCEIAAFHVMEHSKMNIIDVNEKRLGSVFNRCNKLLSFFERDIKAEFQDKNSPISKELKELSSSMCKDYDLSKERVLKRDKERER